MRQFICILSLFALLFSGCVKHEALTPSEGAAAGQQRIAFDCPLVTPKVRSVQEFRNFPADLAFKVWALYSKTETLNINVQNHEALPYYIRGARFTRQGAVWGCPDKDYYWPHSGYLHFIGYAPAQPKSVNDMTSDVMEHGLKLTGYEVPLTADEDLLISRVIYSQRRPSDPESGTQIDFMHALSSVSFTIKSGIYGDRTQDDPTRVDTDLRVVKVEVLGAKSRGNFSQQMASWAGEQQGDATVEKGWTANDTPLKNFTAYDKIAAGTDGMLLNDTLRPIHDKTVSGDDYNITNLILLPQVISDDCILKITYDMTYTGLADEGGAFWVKNQVAQVKMKECGISEWLRGYRYNYSITLSRNKIECTSNVVPWDENDDE